MYGFFETSLSIQNQGKGGRTGSRKDPFIYLFFFKKFWLMFLISPWYRGALILKKVYIHFWQKFLLTQTLGKGQRRAQIQPLIYLNLLIWCLLFFARSRSSRLEVFYKKGVLRNFAKFTGKHLCQCLFFNKVHVNFAKFLRTPFCKEHLWWLLLKKVEDDAYLNILEFYSIKSSTRLKLGEIGPQ